MRQTELVSIVLPVYHEAENIALCLRGIDTALRDAPHEILVCYDIDNDPTLDAIANMQDRPASVRLIKNELGRGVALALRTGFAAARGDVIVTTMADLSDPPQVIHAMVDRVRRDGAAVVSGCRYMRGGRQSGGPRLKGALSRMAGLSLHYVARLATRDPTTNFRAYSAEFLNSTPVESQHGFEVALELTIKAHLNGYKIVDVPSTWTERSAGTTNFRLWRWMPRYLRWYLRAMALPLTVWSALLATAWILWKFANLPARPRPLERLSP